MVDAWKIYQKSFKMKDKKNLNNTAETLDKGKDWESFPISVVLTTT